MIKEQAKAGEVELLYGDESGFSCLPSIQGAWAPLGETHQADASVGRKRANVIGALDYAKGTLDYMLFEHSIKRPQVVEFIDGLAKKSDPERLTVLVMDNATVHHNFDEEVVNRWLVDHRFVVMYLPAYSPELNLIEIVWKHAKHFWRSFKSWSKDKLVEEVHALLSGFGSKFKISYA
ncbi:MAG: IS630 family transposase [Deefgea sp.]